MSREKIISHIDEIHESAFECGYVYARTDALRLCDKVMKKIEIDPEINNPNLSKEDFSKAVVFAVIQELTYLDPVKKYKQVKDYANKG